jgi:methylmalonyl-CoA mutase N-terminal domain/subunit
MIIAIAEKQGISPGACRVNLQNDILKEYICRGTHIFPIEPSVSFCTDVIEFAKGSSGLLPICY